jgi:hypothetical protein
MFNLLDKGDAMGEKAIAIYELDNHEIDFISGGGFAYDAGLAVGRGIRSAVIGFFDSHWGDRSDLSPYNMFQPTGI